MKGSNLKILPAYRMYQAPEGGAEKPVRTSYLKDLSEGSTGRGRGYRRTQTVRTKNVPRRTRSETVRSILSGNQSLARWIVPLEGAGSCPVVNLLHSTCQEPSDSRGVTKTAGQATASEFKVRMFSPPRARGRG